MRSSTYKVLSIPEFNDAVDFYTKEGYHKYASLWDPFLWIMEIKEGGSNVNFEVSIKELLRKPSSLPLEPRLCRSYIMQYFHVESYAFSRSKRIRQMLFFNFIKALQMKVFKQTR